MLEFIININQEVMRIRDISYIIHSVIQNHNRGCLTISSMKKLLLCLLLQAIRYLRYKWFQPG